MKKLRSERSRVIHPGMQKKTSLPTQPEFGAAAEPMSWPGPQFRALNTCAVNAPMSSCACRAGEGTCTAELYRAEVLRLRREREQLLTVLATLNGAGTSHAHVQGDPAAQRSLRRLRLYRQAWRTRRSMSRELARLALELDPTAPRAWSERTDALDLNAVRPVNRTDETDPPAEETPAFSGET